MALGDILDSIRGTTPQQKGGQKGGAKRPPRGFGVFATPTQVQAEESLMPEVNVPFKPGVTQAEIATSQRELRAGTSPQARIRAAQFSGIDPTLPEPSGSILDAANASPANIVIGLQNLIPAIRGEGFEEFKRLREQGVDIGTAIGRAYEAQDFPTGVKGAIEVVAQPDVLVPGAFAAGRLARGLGVAARAGAKSQAGDLAALGGKFAAREMPTVKKFVSLVDEMKPPRAETEVLKSEELSKRAARIDTILKNTPDIRESLRLSRSARAGQLPRAEYESLLGRMSDNEVDELLTIARDNPDLLPFERVRAMSLLDPTDPTSLVNGTLPTLGEIGLLEQVFGEELAEALLKKVPQSAGAKARNVILEIANAPRTTFSSIDISAPGRQAAPAFAANPKRAAGAFAAQLQAWGDEAAAIKVNRSITSHPDSGLLQRAGVFIADVTSPKSGTRLRFDAKTGRVAESSTLSGREEAFISSLPQKLPIVGKFIRASERAYITYLNKLRADIFYGTISDWRAAGKPMTDKSLRQLGDMVNNLTGRGSLDFGDFIKLESSRPFWSAMFFSPGLQASRLQLASSLVTTTDSAVRRQLYKNVGAALLLGTSILGAAKAAGADVEIDPRSTDFGRVKVGTTRLDFWGGFQPYARVAAQLWTQEIKTSSGDVASLPDDFGTTRLGQTGRFLRSKLAPGAGIIVDHLAGETFLGEDPVSPGNALTTVTPGAIQDFIEAINEQGFAKGVPLGLPAFLGIGVTSYSNTTDLYNAVASRLPNEAGDVGRKFEELSQWEKDLVRQDPEVQERIAEIEERAKPVPLRALRETVFKQNEEFRQGIESELLSRVNRGLKGRSLLEAIQDFNRDRFVASQAVFEPFRDRLFKAPSVHKDVLAQEYWTAPLSIAEDGSLDFTARDAIRADVLRRAQAAGVSEAYISGTGNGTWRGTLSDNKRLNELLTEYETDTATLKGYWQIGSDPNYAGIRNHDLWERYLNASQAEQRELARGNPDLQRAISRRTDEREAMRESNPEVDAALVKWYEYLPKTSRGRLLYRKLYILE